MKVKLYAELDEGYTWLGYGVTRGKKYLVLRVGTGKYPRISFVNDYNKIVSPEAECFKISVIEEK